MAVHPTDLRAASDTTEDWSWATIMVVDDELINRQILAGAARNLGVGKVVQAADGEQCLAQLETARPDLIILDIVMPVLDGFETCRRIRASPQWTEVPILVQTALHNPKDLLTCFQVGANDFLSKPIRLTELAARMRVQLENRRLVRTLREANQRMQRDMQGARDMQRTLFPRRPLLDDLRNRHGLEIDSHVDPMETVGGDFWGVHALDEHTIALLGVDFSGHGLMAALNTFWLHAVINEQVEGVRDPAAFLSMLNDAMRANLMRGHFATMFCGVLDLEKNTLLWSGAGAPPPLMWNGERTLRLLDTTGLPLGCSRSPGYTNRSTDFPEGSSLMFFSDGLSDAEPDDGAKLEIQGLCDRIRPCVENDANTSLKTLLAAVLEQPPCSVKDDLTAVLVRRAFRRAVDQSEQLALVGEFVTPATIAAWSQSLGVAPATDPDLSGRLPVRLIPAGTLATLEAAFTSPSAAILEVFDGESPQSPPPPVDAQAFTVSLTTTTAYGLHLGTLFCDALAHRDMLPEEARGNVQLAIQEALANSVVHGNLEMSSPSGGGQDVRAYWAEIRTRLASSQLGRRKILLHALRRDGCLVISVTDQGKGYVPKEDEMNIERPHGRGIALIRQLTSTLEIAQGGRQHVLTFRLS